MLSFISDLLFGALPIRVQAAIVVLMLVAVGAAVLWAVT
jgi:hypothetical protein